MRLPAFARGFHLGRSERRCELRACRTSRSPAPPGVSPERFRGRRRLAVLESGATHANVRCVPDGAKRPPSSARGTSNRTARVDHSRRAVAKSAAGRTAGVRSTMRRCAATTTSRRMTSSSSLQTFSERSSDTFRDISAWARPRRGPAVCSARPLASSCRPVQALRRQFRVRASEGSQEGIRTVGATTTQAADLPICHVARPNRGEQGTYSRGAFTVDQARERCARGRRSGGTLRSSP